MGVCQLARALSPMKATVSINVPFSAGSYVVPEVSAAEISDQASCMKTIDLEIVIIVASGDKLPSRLDGISQMRLAAERTNALRASFRELGVPDWRIYTQADASVTPPYIRQQPDPEGGIARIEYTGVCVGAAGCQVKCKGQRQ